jgi:hypothetical protein
MPTNTRTVIFTLDPQQRNLPGRARQVRQALRAYAARREADADNAFRWWDECFTRHRVRA